MSGRYKERDFPVTSISRISGSRLQQIVSVQESHPLGLNSPLLPESNTFAQKYRAYTPRTRGTPSPAANSSQTAVPLTIAPATLIHPSSPQHHQPANGDVTTKLQLTNAKAEAQNVGLDTGGSSEPSIGWAILEKIVSESEAGQVCADVWTAITSGKATVLLPLELLSSADRLTPEFLKDHVAYCDPSSSSNSTPTPIVTLSGLRGTIHENMITFISTLHPTSRLFQAFEDPSTYSSAFHKLPPLSTSRFSRTGFPSFNIVNSQTILPLPPKPQAQKPPLPPRSGVRPISTTGGVPHVSGSVPSHSRTLNPFASLFGHRPSTPTPPSIPSQPAPASPTSIQSHEFPSTQTHATAAGGDLHAIIEVNVIVIQRKIVRRDVGKVMNESVRREIKNFLNPLTFRTSDGVVEAPEWVVQRVLELSEFWFPFIRAPKTVSSSKTAVVEHGAEKEGEEWVVNPMEVEYLEDTVDLIQDFYAQLEDYLRVELLGTNGHSETSCQERNERATTMREEIKIRGIIELVEKTICSLFYDRLFTQPQTDDSSHDSALSNRIAALNLLDLTLEHLDIAVEEELKSEVEEVVKNCGAKLCEVDSAATPKEKARILVDAHQIVVDGLSRLSAVHLMSAEESKALREQQATLVVKDEDRNGTVVDSNAVPTVTGITSQAKGVSVTAMTTTNEPTLIISKSPPLHGSSTSTQETAPGPVVQLSPLSLTTTSELPFISALETTSPAPHSSSPLLPGTSAPDPSSRTPHNSKPTVVSSDVLLPMLIFSTVKSNPPRLVSNLLYLQRFRHRNVYSYSLDRVDGDGGGSGGEESFCLINMLAVAEFLENVDLAALGLAATSVTGVNPSEFSPTITRNNPQTPATTTATATATPKSATSGVEGLQIPEGSFFLRGKVEQQVDAIAGSANKVISGVVDSSFGILRSLLPQNQTQSHVHTVSSAISADGSTASTVVSGVIDGSADNGVGTSLTTKLGQGKLGLLRRENGFSIASIAASIPSISRNNSRIQQGREEGQQLVTVSRHNSIRSLRPRSKGKESEEDEQSPGESEDENEDTSSASEMESGTEDGGTDQEDQHTSETAILDIQVDQYSHPHPYTDPNSSVTKHTSTGSLGTDSRSIRSFESMLNDSKKQQKENKLKRSVKDNEKKRREEGEKTRTKDQEKTKNEMKMKRGKNVSASADKLSNAPRKSLVDRLASVGARVGVAKDLLPDPRRSPQLTPAPIVSEISSNRQLSVCTQHSESPISSRAASPSLPLSRSPSPFSSQRADPPLPYANLISVATSTASATVSAGALLGDDNARLLPPPKKRFMECSVDELSIGEVRELLSEYRRLVEGVRELDRFSSE